MTSAAAQTTESTESVDLRAVEWTDLDTLTALEVELFADDAWSVES
jgi:hypothetical protein